MDSFINVGGDHTISWDSVWTGGLANVQASFFLRPTRPEPWRAPLRILQRRRLSKSIRTAARERRIVHLWWHPHNFGRHVAVNIAELRRILEVFAECREAHGMRSMSMIEVAESAKGSS
jgi:hypothetical protein